MFQNRRHLFHRTPAQPVQPAGAQPGEPGSELDLSHRHPAMRGINVPPVHGRHCICERCLPRRAA